jgi:hypothetical protein
MFDLFEVHRVEDDLPLYSVTEDVLNELALRPRRFLLSICQGRYCNFSGFHNIDEVLKQCVITSLQGLMLVRTRPLILMCRQIVRPVQGWPKFSTNSYSA